MKTNRLLATLATGSLFFASGAKVSAAQLIGRTNVVFPEITYGRICAISATGGTLAVSGNSRVISSDPDEIAAAAGAAPMQGSPSPVIIAVNGSLDNSGTVSFDPPTQTGNGTTAAQNLVKVGDSPYAGGQTMSLNADGSFGPTSLNVKLVNNSGFKPGNYGATVVVSCVSP